MCGHHFLHVNFKVVYIVTYVSCIILEIGLCCAEHYKQAGIHLVCTTLSGSSPRMATPQHRTSTHQVHAFLLSSGT